MLHLYQELLRVKDIWNYIKYIRANTSIENIVKHAQRLRMAYMVSRLRILMQIYMFVKII